MPKLSSDALFDAMTTHNFYAVQRCNRWGRFERWRIKLRGGSLSSAPAEVDSWWGQMVLDGNVEQQGFDSLRDQCPVDIEEALDTRRCVDALPWRLNETVWQEHVRAARGQREKAWTLGVDRRAYRRRLALAYPMLLKFMDDVAAGLEPGRVASQC